MSAKLEKEWIASIDQRLKYLFDQFDTETQSRLDFSPESLRIVENTILNFFSSPQDYKENKLKHREFLEAAATYIGEVFLKNDKVRNLEWEYAKREDDIDAIFLSCERYKDDVPIVSEFLPITNFRTGEELYEYVTGNINYYEKEGKKILNTLKNAVPVEEDRGRSYPHFILLKDDRLSLQEIERLLKEMYAKMKKEVTFINRNDSELILKMNSGYQFHFLMDRGDHVAEESKEIAEDYEGKKDKTAIANCKSRIEFWGDGDENMDYMNDSLFILDKLSGTEKVFPFSLNAGTFYDEQ